MARIRSVKPDAWQDPRVGRLTVPARLLWVVLLTMADDSGRFLAMPPVIFGHGYPHDPGSLQAIPVLLEELDAAGLVTLYEIDGVPYGAHPKWSSHQKISHPTPSRLPAPPERHRIAPEITSGGDSGAAPEILRGDRRGEDRSGEEGNGQRASAPPAEADAWVDPMHIAGDTWRTVVEPVLSTVTDWQAALMNGAGGACLDLIAVDPDAPWDRIAAAAAEARRTGTMGRATPQGALRAVVESWKRGSLPSGGPGPGAQVAPEALAELDDWVANQAPVPTTDRDWIDHTL